MIVKGVDVEKSQIQSRPYERDLSPMERWSRETQIERHWDGIQSIVLLLMQEPDDPGSGSGDQSGTDDGIWIRSSFSRKNRAGVTAGS